MTILVTGASGQLGRLVVDALLRRGAAPSSITAGARDIARIADLADRGVRTVRLDYSDPGSVAEALIGIDRVLLISGSEPGGRLAGHVAVIEAAAGAKVSKLVYTSAPQATTFEWALGADHRATEQAIAASGVPSVIVRNNWYVENYLADVERARESGVIAAAAGDGLVAAATRADLAEGAAVVLLEDGHLGAVYELGGDRALSYDEIAAAAGEVLGREVVYQRLERDEQIAGLQAAGLDAGVAGFVASIDEGIRGGVLAVSDGTLARLIGRPTTPFAEGLRAALR